MTEQSGASLELSDLTVAYRDVTALAGISLAVQAGEFFCLLGPSGCGKSTLLGAVAGFIGVQSGRVVLNGRDVTRLSMQERQVGVVFQSYALFPHMTAAENVAYGLQVRKMPKPEIKRRVDELLGLVKLDGKGDRFPRHLSGGEQQRVAIARSLAISPSLLLLDEPLSNLDARLRDEMRVELKRIQATSGVTTVFVTHDQEEAFGLGDRIAILSKGHLEQVGTPQEIYRRPKTHFAAGFIGRANVVRGTIEQTNAGPVLVSHGQRVRVHQPPTGDRDAALYLRPEELCVGRLPEVDNRWPAHVLEVVYAGPVVTARLETPLGEMEASLSAASATALSAGQSIEIGWPKEAGFFVAKGRSEPTS